MAGFGSRIVTSAEQLAVRAGAASSVTAGNGNWEVASGMDQITVVRIDDTHIVEGQSHVGGKVKGDGSELYEVEYLIPTEGEEEVVGEEEEDSVYVIEYSNPEEEGESYQFTMSVDRSLPARKPVINHPVVRENVGAPVPSRPRHEVSQNRKLMSQEEVKKEETLSNRSVLALGEGVMEVDSGSGEGRLVCTLCSPPGKLFKRASGLAVHLKQMHHAKGKKTFFCTSCKQTLRSQVELDAHTRRHANQGAVFTCRLCPAEAGGEAGFRGSRWGLRKHLEKEHPGVIPRCDICSKGFKTLMSYLADQFRHVGVSPYYCAKCQIYEMTERGLSVHTKNHNNKKKKRREQPSPGNQPPTSGVPASAENSATDDSDF